MLNILKMVLKIFTSFLLLGILVIGYHLFFVPPRIGPGRMSFAKAQEQSFHRDKDYIYADWMDKVKRAQMPDGTPLVDLNKIPLRFMPLGDKYLLTSAGKDKEFNTEDDVETTIHFR